MIVHEQKVCPLIIRPHMIRLKPEQFLQFGIAAHAPENHLIDATELIEIHELIISPDIFCFRPCRNNACHMRGDRRCAKGLQHADTFMSFLNIEPAHVFKADNRIRDAFCAQVRRTQIDPFVRKLRHHRQDRHEVSCKRGLASTRQCPDNTVRRNINDSHVHTGCGHGFVIDFFQYAGVWTDPLCLAVIIVLLPCSECSTILFNCIGSFAHNTPLLFRIS